jgi:hypothetical protein
MPTSPFFEVSPVQRHVGPPADASDVYESSSSDGDDRAYINNGIGAAPTLGWKSPALNTEVRAIAPSSVSSTLLSRTVDKRNGCNSVSATTATNTSPERGGCIQL